MPEKQYVLLIKENGETIEHIGSVFATRVDKMESGNTGFWNGRNLVLILSRDTKVSYHEADRKA